MIGGSAPESRRRPLRDAILDCERRWLQDTLLQAQEGDATAMALLASMYTIGYGHPDRRGDPQQASVWYEEASQRLGYDVRAAQQQQQRQQQGQHQQPGAAGAAASGPPPGTGLGLAQLPDGFPLAQQAPSGAGSGVAAMQL